MLTDHDVATGLHSNKPSLGAGRLDDDAVVGGRVVS